MIKAQGRVEILIPWEVSKDVKVLSDPVTTDPKGEAQRLMTCIDVLKHIRFHLNTHVTGRCLNNVEARSMLGKTPALEHV